MLARTIISLEAKHLRALKARARAEGVSVAELVRRLVTQSLESAQVAAPIPPGMYRRIVALGSSGRPDVVDRHDALLGKILRSEHDG